MPVAADSSDKHGHGHHLVRGHQRPHLALAGNHSAPRSSTGALLSLSQDITALVSLSVESTASLLNDRVRSALGFVGLGDYVRSGTTRRAESTHGLAIVVVGAADPVGQSLTLRLAKSGYTVFPFMPIAATPSAGSAPATAPLSALLLAWSGVQKRLQARDPTHTGAVVPVVIDESGDAFLSHYHHNHTPPPSPPKRNGRFTHAGDTVRHYCRENHLSLVAVVCAAPTAIRPKTAAITPYSLTSPSRSPQRSPTRVESGINGVPSSGLAYADEEALMALYRAHILDPLSVIRSLGDVLAPQGKGQPHGRVLFVESAASVDELEAYEAFGARSGASRMIAAARAEAARLLRAELGPAGIDVCEIVVGPMSPRLTGPLPLRSSSGDSDTDRALAASNGELSRPAQPRDDALASRLRLLARIFAVDDALVYSCVRRAIEDRYPRARHHAGLAPLISSVVSATPGTGVIRFLGRWVLGRLFSRPSQ